MPRVRIDDVGKIGVVKDVPAYELPQNAWTDCTNVRMQDGSVHKALGYSDLFTGPTVAPYFVFPVQTPAAYYWLYAGLNKVYAIQNKYHFDITRASGDYEASVYQKWNGTNLGGVIVLNNGVDVPQYWKFPNNHSNRLQDMTGWPSTDRAKVIRSYKNYLVATNVERSGTVYPELVKWSHRADIGALPSSWDITDPTLDSGENLLPQEGGDLLDQLVLRDINVLYRSDSTWAMQFIGSNAIFRFWQIFTTSGILAVDCVKEFFGSHFVVTGDDIVVHDGQNVKSVATNRVRRHFFNDIDTSNYDRTFVTHNKADKEIWVCYPRSGSDQPDRAWVWSYAENTWACRDFTEIAHATYGVVDSLAEDAWDKSSGRWSNNSQTWASATASWSVDDVTWDADDKPWNYRTFNAQLAGMLLADSDNTKLYVGDDTNQIAGINMTASIERTGLSLIGPGKTDMYSRKQIRALYPHIEGTAGGVVNCYVGTQNSIDETVSWSSAYTYTIGSTYKVPVRADGRLIAVKFESTTDIEWRMHAYQMDIEVSGDR